MSLDENVQVIVEGLAVKKSNPFPILAEGFRANYGYGAAQITPAATPTDIVTLYGAANVVARVKKIIVSGIATTAGSMDVSIVKRTAANTAGTSAAKTPGKYDSADGAPAATLSEYSANPTALGAGVTLLNKILNLGLAGAAGTVEFDFSKNNDKPLLLRGAAQGVAINLNGQAVPAGGKVSYTIEWEEASA